MKKRPIIGISCNYTKDTRQISLKDTYVHAIMNAGGLPLLLPLTADEQTADLLLDQLDGLLLSGGGDILPARYGEETLPVCGPICEERDVFELMITKKALERRMPIFGICRGIQVLAVAMGGSLFQDIESQLGLPKEKHKQEPPYDDTVHTVRFKEGGLFERITQTPLMPTNSMHHQAIKEAGSRLKIEGITMDGIIEAVSAVDNDAVIGVEFHPECLAHYSDFASRIFDYFISKAESYRKEQYHP